MLLRPTSCVHLCVMQSQALMPGPSRAIRAMSMPLPCKLVRVSSVEPLLLRAASPSKQNPLIQIHGRSRLPRCQICRTPLRVECVASVYSERESHTSTSMRQNSTASTADCSPLSHAATSRIACVNESNRDTAGSHARSTEAIQKPDGSIASGGSS